jgi:hypothetical protein
MQALCGAELRWSPPNWELRNLGGRACFHLQQTPLVLGSAATLAPIWRAANGDPGRVCWIGAASRRNGPLAPLAGRVAYRRLFAGILLCCAKELLLYATRPMCWAVDRLGLQIAIHAQFGHSPSRLDAQRCGRHHAVCL